MQGSKHLAQRYEYPAIDPPVLHRNEPQPTRQLDQRPGAESGPRHRAGYAAIGTAQPQHDAVVGVIAGVRLDESDPSGREKVVTPQEEDLRVAADPDVAVGEQDRAPAALAG